MVRGLCTSLQYPYAQFACNSLKGHQMYRPVLEAMLRLENIGLKVNMHTIVHTIESQIVVCERT